jgi:hypothetical protein
VRIYLTSSERKPDPEPVATNDRRTVLVGMAVWALLWVAALVLHGWLAAQGRGWWVWTPPVGIALGFLGLRYLRGRERHRP